MRAYDAGRPQRGRQHRPNHSNGPFRPHVRCAGQAGRAGTQTSRLPPDRALAATPDPPWSARSLLHAVLARYASLQRYADTGCTRSDTGLGKRYERRFVSRLDAERDFRFEFASPHPYPPLRHREQHFAVGQLAGVPYFSQRRPSGEEDVQSPGSLRVAVAMATGISGGSAHTLGTLLFPETGESLLGLLLRPRRRRPRVVNGVLCHQVRGRHPCGGRIRLFVGMQDLLLRRLDEFRVKSTELRWPQLESASISPAPNE